MEIASLIPGIKGSKAILYDHLMRLEKRKFIK